MTSRSEPGNSQVGGQGSEQIHVWKRCYACDLGPIVGPSFECQTCPDGPDNDLCEACHAGYLEGRVKHPMPGSFADAAEVHAGKKHQFERRLGVSRAACLHWAHVPDVRETAP